MPTLDRFGEPMPAAPPSRRALGFIPREDFIDHDTVTGITPLRPERAPLWTLDHDAEEARRRR